MLRYDATRVLDELTIPVGVIGGDQDTVTLPEASRHMAGTIARAQLKMLSPAKHLGFFEHHATFAEALGEAAHRSASLLPTTP